MLDQDGPQFNSPASLKVQETLSPTRRQLTLDVNKFKREAERLESFKYGWKSQCVKPEKLACAGFYYTLTQDKVQCAFCNGIVGNWEPNDDPLTEHCRHFPLCPFLLKIDVGNVPIKNTNFRGQNLGGEDVCSRYINNSNPTSLHDNALIKAAHLHNNYEEMGIQVAKPHHSAQAVLPARQRSFNNPDVPWPAEKIVSGEDLANAGFFYIGVDDSTRCFHCNGGLTNWEKGDDPWVEHARWFPKCSYVKLNKGESFIKECRLKNPPILQDANQAAARVQEQSSTSGIKVEDLMGSSIVGNALNMGMLENDIREALQRQLNETGAGFSTPSELLDAIQKINQPSAADVCNRNYSRSSDVFEKQAQNGQDEVYVKSKCDEPTDTIASLSLEEENRVLKEQKMCKICMDQEIGVVFLPCGHLICCTRCAPAFTDCPLCRTNIKGTVRTFMS